MTPFAKKMFVTFEEAAEWQRQTLTEFINEGWAIHTTCILDWDDYETGKTGWKVVVRAHQGSRARELV